MGRGRDWVEGRDGSRVRAAEAQRREERLGRAHGDAATNSRLVNDVIPQGKTRFAAIITGSTTHNDDEYRRDAARALLATPRKGGKNGTYAISKSGTLVKATTLGSSGTDPD